MVGACGQRYFRNDFQSFSLPTEDLQQSFLAAILSIVFSKKKIVIRRFSERRSPVLLHATNENFVKNFLGVRFMLFQAISDAVEFE